MRVSMWVVSWLRISWYQLVDYTIRAVTLIVIELERWLRFVPHAFHPMSFERSVCLRPTQRWISTSIAHSIFISGTGHNWPRDHHERMNCSISATKVSFIEKHVTRKRAHNPVFLVHFPGVTFLRNQSPCDPLCLAIRGRWAKSISRK